MTSSMSKEKKTAKEHEDLISVRLDAETAAAFEAFRNAQRIRPHKTVVMTTALREFLEREGYLPDPGKE